MGNKAIALKNCRNVIFRDFSILKGGHFGLLLTGVDNMTIVPRRVHRHMDVPAAVDIHAVAVGIDLQIVERM